jgi:hypothetical protein
MQLMAEFAAEPFRVPYPFEAQQLGSAVTRREYSSILSMRPNRHFDVCKQAKLCLCASEALVARPGALPALLSNQIALAVEHVVCTGSV